jgi:hypothetical protein
MVTQFSPDDLQILVVYVQSGCLRLVASCVSAIAAYFFKQSLLGLFQDIIIGEGPYLMSSFVSPEILFVMKLFRAAINVIKTFIFVADVVAK